MLKTTLLTLLAFAPLLACADKGDDGAADDTGQPGDGGGTTGDGGGTTDGGTTEEHLLSVTQATIPTTGLASWTPTQGVSEVWVTYGVEGDTTWRASASIADGTASAVLRGMRPGLEHTVKAWEMQDGAEVEVDSVVATAGAVSGTLPDADFVVDEEGRNQLFMVSSVLSTPSRAVIYNGHGEVVWWHEPLFENHVIIRAWPAHDGTGVQYMSRSNPKGKATGVESYLVKVDWTGDVVETEALQDAHHDFYLHEDGTTAYLAEDVVEIEGTAYVGDRLIVRTLDGTEQELWSVWDSFTLDDAPDVLEGTTWSHANAVDYDAEDGIYYISLRNFNAIVGVDAATGEKVWQFGGNQSDYPEIFTDTFNWQHQFEWQDDGSLMIFDNGNTDRLFSRVMQYVFDDDTMTVEAVFEHISDPPTFCYGPGDVHKLENGNTIVTWGSAGRIQEVTADGTLLWDNLFGIGGAFGYTTWVEDLNAL